MSGPPLAFRSLIGFQRQIGTGASAFMAIRVLLDHGVPQDHIIFVTFLVSEQGGITVLQKAFPHVKIVCSAVDEHLTERWLEVLDADSEGEGFDDDAVGRKVWVIEPGMGHIGGYSRSARCILSSSDIWRLRR